MITRLGDRDRNRRLHLPLYHGLPDPRSLGVTWGSGVPPGGRLQTPIEEDSAVLEREAVVGAGGGGGDDGAGGRRGGLLVARLRHFGDRHQHAGGSELLHTVRIFFENKIKITRYKTGREIDLYIFLGVVHWREISFPILSLSHLDLKKRTMTRSRPWLDHDLSRDHSSLFLFYLIQHYFSFSWVSILRHAIYIYISERDRKKIHYFGMIMLR